MSALQDEIREAVRAELAEMLPSLIRAATIDAVASVRIGDSGDDLIDAKEAFKALGYRSVRALQKAIERGTCPVPPVDLPRLKVQPSDGGPMRRTRRKHRWRRADVLACSAAVGT